MSRIFNNFIAIKDAVDDRVRVFEIAKALEIRPDGKLLEDIANEIIDKIGPLMFKMLLINRITFDTQGNWRIDPVTKEYLKERMKQLKIEDVWWLINKEEFLTEFLCFDRLTIDGERISIRNDFSKYRGEIGDFLSDFTKGTTAQLEAKWRR